LGNKKEGYLTKQGAIVKSWHVRWFVLEGTSLYYYQDKSTQEGKGVIDLRNCSVSVAPEQTKRPFGFAIIHLLGRRSYFLSAETKEDMDEWISELKETISVATKSPKKEQH